MGNNPVGGRALLVTGGRGRDDRGSWWGELPAGAGLITRLRP